MIRWVDHPNCSSAFVDLEDGTMYHLSVDSPGQYTAVWTAEASHLNADYHQIKYSGMLNGGQSRESAKSAALVAQKKLEV